MSPHRRQILGKRGSFRVTSLSVRCCPLGAEEVRAPESGRQVALACSHLGGFSFPRPPGFSLGKGGRWGRTVLMVTKREVAWSTRRPGSPTVALSSPSFYR